MERDGLGGVEYLQLLVGIIKPNTQPINLGTTTQY